MTSTIRITLSDLGEAVPAGRSFVHAVLLNAQGQKTGPINLETGAVVAPSEKVVEFDSMGIVSIPLVQTRHLPRNWTYRIDVVLPDSRVLRWDGVTIPDSDRDWVAVIGQHDPGRLPEHVVLTQEELERLYAGVGGRAHVAAPISGDNTADDPLTIADGAIERAKLEQDVRDDIGGSVALEGVSVDGAGNLNIFDNEGNAPSGGNPLYVGVDGLRVVTALEGVGAGGRLRVDEGTRGNLPASRVSGLPAVPSGGHAGQDDLDAVEADVAELQERSNALRGTRTLFSGLAWTQVIGGAATRLPGGPAFPADSPTAELLITIGGDVSVSGKVDVSDVGAANQTDQLTSGASISGSGYTFYFRHEGGDGQWLVASDSGGSFTITASLNEIKIPDARLATTPRTDAQVQTLAAGQVNTLIPPSTRIPTPKSGDSGKVAAVNASEDGIELVTPATGGVDSSAVNTLIDTRIPEVKRVPDIATADAGRVLKVNAGGTAADWEEDATGGGAGTPAALAEYYNAAAVVITTGTTAGVWTGWSTIASFTATAAQAGVNILIGHVHGTSSSGDGGGDRIFPDVQLLRRRAGETDLQVIDDRNYIRNAGNFGNAATTPPNQVNEASRHGTDTAVVAVDLLEGDTLLFQVRVISQTPSETLTFAASTASARNNVLQALTLGTGGSGGTGGVTLAQVNAAILAALPLNKRLPDYAVGDANEVLKVNATGTGLVFSPEAVGLTLAQVNQRITALVPGLAATAADAEIISDVEAFARAGTRDRIGEARLPTKLDDLIDAVDERGWQDAGSDPTRDVWVSNAVYVSQRPANPQTATYVRSYDDVTPAVLNRYILVRVPDAAMQPGDNLRMNVGERNDNYDIASSSSDWTFLSRVGNVRYFSALIARAPAEADMRAQYFLPFRLDPARVNSVPTDGTDGEYLERVSGRGQWRPVRQLPAGGTEGQVLRRGAAAAEWYTQPTPPHTEEIHDGPGAGLTIQNTNSTVNSAFTLFDPPGTDTTWDLDDDDHQHGELNVEITLTISTRSANDLGFGATQVLTHRFVDIVFASTLRALGDFAIGTPATWLAIGNPVSLNQGGTNLGPVQVFFGHNANNELGYFVRYVGRASAGANLAIGSRVGVLWSPTDVPTVPPTPTATVSTRGRLVFSTGILPTNTLSNNDRLDAGAFRFGTAQYGYARSGTRLAFREPARPAAGQIGSWIVSLIGSTEHVSVFLPFRAPVDADTVVHFHPSDAERDILRLTRNSTGFVEFLGAGQALPANFRLRIYEATIGVTLA